MNNTNTRADNRNAQHTLGPSYRYEVIDRCDIVCAVADLLSDAMACSAENRGSYVYDTINRKVCK